MAKFKKQSYEEFTIAMDFVEVMDVGEGIASEFVTAKDADGTDVTSTVTDQATVASSGTQVTVLVRAGVEVADNEEASTYAITAKIVTDSVPAHAWELDVNMIIKELP